MCGSASPSKRPETSAFFNDLHRLVIGRRNGFHHVLFRRSGGALPPAPAGRIHGQRRHEIAQRNRLRNHGSRRRHPRRLRQPGAGGRWRSAGAGARATLPAGIDAPPLRHAIPLWSADGDDSRTTNRGNRREGPGGSSKSRFATTRHKFRPIIWSRRRGTGIPAAESRRQHRPHR